MVKDRGSKIYKWSIMLYESFLVYRSNYVDNGCENCFKDVLYGENCVND